MAKLTVIWNQRSYPMNDVYKQAYNSNQISVSFNNNEGTVTWIAAGKYGYNCTLITTSSNYRTPITKPCVIYLAYDLYTTISGSWSFEYAGQLPPTPIVVPANTWKRVAFIYTMTGSGTGNERELIPNLRSSTAKIGDTAIIKNNIIVNLTQMYGVGNEPATVQEFEAQCKLNGIDLSKYQPLNITGTERVWYTSRELNYPEIEYLRKKISMNSPHTLVSNEDTSFLSITSDMQAKVKNYKVYFEALQLGGGDPAVENIRPLTGISEIKAYHTGANIYPEDMNYVNSWYISLSGKEDSTPDYKCGINYIPVKPNTTYTVVVEAQNDVCVTLPQYDINKNFISRTSPISRNQQATPGTYTGQFTTSLLTRYVRFSIIKTCNMIGIFENNTNLNQSAAKAYYVQWTNTYGPIYGGYYDIITGILTKTHEIYTFNGSEDWSDIGDSWNTNNAGFCLHYEPIQKTGTEIKQCNMFKIVNPSLGPSTINSILNYPPSYANLCIHTKNSYTVAEFKALLNEHNLQIVCNLDTPVSYILNNEQNIITFKGLNNFWTENNMKQKIVWWSHGPEKSIYLTISGLPVLYQSNEVQKSFNNAYYTQKNNYLYNGIYNNTYFIAGPFDTGSSDSKNYTFPRIENSTNSSASLLLFNDISSNTLSYDWWGITASSVGLPAYRTMDMTGRYITTTVNKTYADEFYIFDNTNQQYICKGKKIIDIEIPSEYQVVQYLSRTADYPGPYCNIDFMVNTNYRAYFYIKPDETNREMGFAGTFEEYDGSQRIEIYYTSSNDLSAWSNTSGVVSYLTLTRTNADIDVVTFGSSALGIKRLGAYRTSDYYKYNGKIYGMTLKDEYHRLLHNLVPVVRISDSEPGFFDRCTGTFYSNDAPTGQWIAGPNIT